MNRCDLERLRIYFDRAADFAQAQAEGRPSFVGRIVTPDGVKLAPGKMIRVQPVDVFGAETEGAVPTFTDVGAVQAVYLMGPGTPRSGDRVICWATPRRWICRRKNGAPSSPVGNMIGCTCAHPPATLTLTRVYDPSHYFDDCTLQFGPTPTELVGLLGLQCYLSTATFTATLPAWPYRYHLACFFATFSLRRIYLDTGGAFGDGPFMDVSTYGWSVGTPGNSCSPFKLIVGEPLPGWIADIKIE